MDKYIALRLTDPHSILALTATRIRTVTTDGIIKLGITEKGYSEYTITLERIAEVIQDETGTIEKMRHYMNRPMNQCGDCKRKYAPEVKFCRHCGTKLKIIPSYIYMPPFKCDPPFTYSKESDFEKIREMKVKKGIVWKVPKKPINTCLTCTFFDPQNDKKGRSYYCTKFKEMKDTLSCAFYEKKPKPVVSVNWDGEIQ